MKRAKKTGRWNWRFVALAGLLPVVASAFTPEEFKWALEANGKRIQSDFWVDLEGQQFDPFSDLQQNEKGAWQFVLRAFAKSGYRSGKIRGGRAAVIQGEGGNYQYAFRTASLGGKMAEEMLKHDKIKDRQRWLAKEREDIKGQLTLQDGQLIITADVLRRGNNYEIRDRLFELMNQSAKMLEEIQQIEDEVAGRRYDTLNKSPLTEVDNADLFIVFNENLSEYAEKNDQAKLGYWKWSKSDKYHMEVYNQGDEVWFSQWFDVGSDPELKKAVMAKAEAEAQRNRLKHATAMVVADEPGYAKLFSVRAVYDLKKGGLRAEHLRQAYEHFDQSWGKEFGARMLEAIKRSQEEHWSAIREKRPAYLSKQEFMDVIGDDLSSLQKDKEGVKEGYFPFVRNKRLKLEVFNYGDSITLVQWWKFPKDPGEARRAEALAKFNEYIRDHRLPHLEGNVKAWSAYNTGIQVDAKIPLGAYTNQQIREMYDKFTNEWGDELYRFAKEIVR